jgi:hypothetical protein
MVIRQEFIPTDPVAGVVGKKPDHLEINSRPQGPAATANVKAKPGQRRP